MFDLPLHLVDVLVWRSEIVNPAACIVAATMPTIAGRFYAGFGRYSAYQSLIIQRARGCRKPMTSSATAVSTLTSAFSTALSNLTQGLAELAAKAAIKRISDQAAAKAAAVKSGLDLKT